MIKFYATRAIAVGGIEFNDGDLVPSHLVTDANIPGLRMEGGTKHTPTASQPVDARDGAGLTSKSFEEPTAETTVVDETTGAEVTALFVDGEDDTVVEEQKPAPAPRGGRK